MVRNAAFVQGIEKIGDLHLVCHIPDILPGGGKLPAHQHIDIIGSCQLPGNGRDLRKIRAEISEQEADLFTQYSAGRIDLLDGQLIGIAAAGRDFRISAGNCSDDTDPDLLLSGLCLFNRHDDHLIREADLDGKVLSLRR